MNSLFLKREPPRRTVRCLLSMLLPITALSVGIVLGLVRNVSAGSVVPAMATIVVAADPQPYQAAERHAITGRVLDPQGAPIEQAYVCLSVSRSRERAWEGPTILAKGESGKGGQFRLTPSKQEVDRYSTSRTSSFELWVHKPGWTVGMHQTLGRPEGRPVELRLEPEASFEITVRDSGGKPAVAATITPTSCTFADEVWLAVPRTIRSRLTAVSDEKGKARLSGLRLEQIRDLIFAHPDIGAQQYCSRIGLPMATDFTLLPVGSLYGRLQAPAEVKVDLTKVRLRIGTLDPTLNDPEERWYGHAEVVPDQEGWFRIPQIAVGTVGIFVIEPEEFPLRVDPSQAPTVVLAGMTTELDLPLKQTIPVTQSVVDAETGQPLKNVYVSLQSRSFHAGVRTDGDGIAVMKVLPGADYYRYVEVPEEYIPERVSSAQDTIRISNYAEAYELETVKFSLGRSVRGFVLDAAGKPIAGALVKADWAAPGHEQDPHPERGPFLHTILRTDRSGRFFITGIGARTDVVLTPVLGTIDLGDKVRATADELGDVILTTRALEVTSLSGRIMDTEGHPVEGAKIFILTMRNGSRETVCRVWSGIDGTFVTPPHLLKGERCQIQVTTNATETKSEWYELTDANQTLPDFVIDRKKLGIRAYIDRSAVQK